MVCQVLNNANDWATRHPAPLLGGPETTTTSEEPPVETRNCAEIGDGSALNGYGLACGMNIPEPAAHLKEFKGFNFPSCLELCADMSWAGCVAVAYQRNTKSCNLKRKAEPRVPDAKMDVGYELPAPTTTEGTVEPTDAPAETNHCKILGSGANYRGWAVACDTTVDVGDMGEYPASTFQRCMEICTEKANDGCLAVTFDQEGSNCHLKRTALSQSSEPGVDTAYRSKGSRDCADDGEDYKYDGYATVCDTDIPGNDLSTLSATSFGECIQYCSDQEEECAAVVYYHRVGMCYLKSAGRPQESRQGADVAYVTSREMLVAGSRKKRSLQQPMQLSEPLEPITPSAVDALGDAVLLTDPSKTTSGCAFTETAIALESDPTAFEFGCYESLTVGQHLPASKNNTPSDCNERCLALGWLISATHHGSNCTCYPLQRVSYATRLPTEECSIPCSGNNKLNCGGNSTQLSVIVNPEEDTFCPVQPPVICVLEKTGIQIPPGGYKFGCYENLIADIAFASNDKLTPFSCNQECRSRGYRISGTSYGQTCLCFDEKAVPKRYRMSDHECNVPCKGDGNQTCGGGAPRALYNLVVNTRRDYCPVAPALNCAVQGQGELVPPGGYKFGCYRSLNEGQKQPVWNYNTPVACNNRCLGLGFVASGTSQGSLCICYHARALPTRYRMPDAYCNTPCPGNRLEMCGGMSADLPVNVVVNTNANFCPARPPITSCSLNETGIVVQPGAFKYGCYENVPYGLRLPLDTTRTNSAANCNKLCLERGYPVSGTYKGVGCACFPAKAMPPTIKLADAYCSSVCSGNATEKCGGPEPRSIVNLVVNTTPDFCPEQQF